MSRSHADHKRIMRKAEFALADERMWYRTGFQAHELGVVGWLTAEGKLSRDLGLGGRNLSSLF